MREDIGGRCIYFVGLTPPNPWSWEDELRGRETDSVTSCGSEILQIRL